MALSLRAESGLWVNCCAFSAIYKVTEDRETDGENTVFLDWCITYAYICVNVNRYYILTSKIPIQKGVSAMPPPLVRADILLLGVFNIVR